MANRYNEGIALIQVLLIIAILSVFALYLTSTARDQVKIAQWAVDKAQATVDITSAESVLLFELLTKNKEQSTNTSGSSQGISSRWNFFSTPFSISTNVTAQIQDQAALLHAYYPRESRLKALLNSHTSNENETNRIYDALLDWQDLDSISRLNGHESMEDLNLIRNGAVPDIHDFYLLPTVSKEIGDLLVRNMSMYRKGIFNPTNSPKELLVALTNDVIASRVIVLRESGQLTGDKFSQLTGIYEDESTLFYSSNIISIVLTGKVGYSKAEKTVVVELSPYASGLKPPINVLSNRG